MNQQNLRRRTQGALENRTATSLAQADRRRASALVARQAVGPLPSVPLLNSQDATAAALRSGAIDRGQVARVAAWAQHPASWGRSDVATSLMQLVRGGGNTVALRDSEDGSDTPELVGNQALSRLGGGEPLSAAMRAELGSTLEGLGVPLDLARVRVHTGAAADNLCRQLGARAFTSGHHIAFRAGLYQPATRVGLELLAHELTHVCQFEAGRVELRRPDSAATPLLRDQGLEAESRTIAAAVGQGHQGPGVDTATVSAGSPRAAERGPIQLDEDYANSRVWRDWEDASAASAYLDVSASGVSVFGDTIQVLRDSRGNVSDLHPYYRALVANSYSDLKPLVRPLSDPTQEVRDLLAEQTMQLGELLQALNHGYLRASIANVLCLAERHAHIHQVIGALRDGVVARGERTVRVLEVAKVMATITFTAAATVAVPASAPLLVLALNEAEALGGAASSAAVGDRGGVITGVTEMVLAPLTSLADLCGLKGVTHLLMSLSTAVISAMIQTLVGERASGRPRGMSEKAWSRQIWRKCVASGFSAGTASLASAGLSSIGGTGTGREQSQAEKAAWEWLTGVYGEFFSRAGGAIGDAVIESQQQHDQAADEAIPWSEAEANANAVQRKASKRPSARSTRKQGQEKAGQDRSRVLHAAAGGVADGGAPLPFREQLQAAFGAHDLREVTAHSGGAAADACAEIGAEAYATEERVAFASAPSLRVAAHEAAHIVQQRQGHAAAGYVGSAGDALEAHADRVADHVVAGRSAEALLGAPAPSNPRVAVQRRDAWETLSGEDIEPTEDVDNLGSRGHTPSDENLQQIPTEHVIFEQLAHRFAYCDEATIGRSLDLRHFGYQLGAYFDDVSTGLRVMRFDPLRGGGQPRTPPPVPVVAFRGTELKAGPYPGSEIIIDDLGAAHVGQYQFARHEPDILEMLLGAAEAPVVVGHSLGGALAQRTATRYPNLVSAVVTFQSPAIGKDEKEVRGDRNMPSADRPCREERTPESTHYSIDGDIVDDAGERFTEGKRVHMSYRGVATPRSHMTFPLANVENQRGGRMRGHLRDSAGAEILNGNVDSIDYRADEGNPSSLLEGARAHNAELLGGSPLDPGRPLRRRLLGDPLRRDQEQGNYLKAWETACRKIADGGSVSEAIRSSGAHNMVSTGDLTPESATALEENLQRWQSVILSHLGEPGRERGRRPSTRPVVR